MYNTSDEKITGGNIMELYKEIEKFLIKLWNELYRFLVEELGGVLVEDWLLPEEE